MFKNTFIIAISTDNLDFLEKDYKFYMNLRVIVQERLKSYEVMKTFKVRAYRIHLIIATVKMIES